MGTTETGTWLSYAEAAKRVRSSEGTVRRWRRDGMPMGWRSNHTGQRYRVVEESVLLSWWRERMQARPVHFYRMRAKAIKQSGTSSLLPERFTKQPTTASTASPAGAPGRR